MTLLIVENLTKTYATADGPFPVLRGVSLTLDDSGTCTDARVSLGAVAARAVGGRV